MKKSSQKLAVKDKRYVWHPFTQMRDWEKEDILIIRRGRGVTLEDTEGRKYLDGVSSLWCNVHGHTVPELDRAVKKQLQEIAHSTFLGLSNVPAVLLAEKLIRTAPRGLKRVFYSDSGSEAVEIALKMAFQYWKLKGHPQKNKFINLSSAYHGDTVGSVSVGGIDLFHRIFKSLLFKTYTVPAPCYSSWNRSDAEEIKQNALEKLERLLKKHHRQIAAMIMEPLIQGAAGMITHPPGFLKQVRRLTRKYHVLLILDEVATGFGRTGKMFACEHEKVSPDILTAAKGLTGGYLPLAVTLTTEEIYRAFRGKYEEFKAFFHGHTYTANPLACRTALASLELFKKRKVLKNLKNKIKLLRLRLQSFRRIPIVADVRQVGMMAGIELAKDQTGRRAFAPEEKIGIRVIERARKKGAILRPLGPVVVLMPPLAISKNELERLLDITFESIAEIGREQLNHSAN